MFIFIALAAVSVIYGNIWKPSGQVVTQVVNNPNYHPVFCFVEPEIFQFSHFHSIVWLTKLKHVCLLRIWESMWTSTGISSTIFWPVLTQTISLFKVINIGRLADAENKKVVLVSWLNSTLLYRHFFLSVCSKRLIILLIILSVGCLVSKMSENGDKPKIASLNV